MEHRILLRVKTVAQNCFLVLINIFNRKLLTLQFGVHRSYQHNVLPMSRSVCYSFVLLELHNSPGQTNFESLFHLRLESENIVIKKIEHTLILESTL